MGVPCSYGIVDIVFEWAAHSRLLFRDIVVGPSIVLVAVL